MRADLVQRNIVPTPVGVNRTKCHLCGYAYYCPHARGGEPLIGQVFMPANRLSPRPWG